ncbi:MAG: hypothetical protein JWN18_89 [Parcubacteria group bacterium]|nr:hypothetical protein [Parcubacteria group bacterium]
MNQAEESSTGNVQKSPDESTKKEANSSSPEARESWEQYRMSVEQERARLYSSQLS